MNKILRSPYLVLLIVVIVIAVIGLSFASQKSSSASSCTTKGSIHKIAIKGSGSNNPDVKGKLCDQLMFTNVDKTQVYEVAFGPHDEHQPYDGIGERVLKPGQSFTITLNESGQYHWHDHLKDVAEGYFTVTK